MNFKVLTYAIALFVTVTCALVLCGGKNQKAQEGMFTVAVDVDMPGYASFDGEGFGYMYDILKAYADERGLALHVVADKTAGECRRLLKRGAASAAAILGKTHDTEIAVPLYNTSYMILAGVREARRISESPDPHALLAALGTSRLLITEGFRSSHSYDTLLDTIPEADIFVASRDCFELIEQVREGVYDFLICEKSEAHIGCALYAGVEPVYEFEETFPVYLSFAVGQSALAADFGAWNEEYRNDQRFALLTQLYFDEGKAVQLTHRVPREDYEDVISPYDKVMREVCEREGYDWRFISAIAYNESRFKERIVSHRGAAGLMQIMPATARQFDVPQEEIFKPEVNIMLATKLLGRIEGMLKFPSGASFDDKMRIILACYNCGIGHVLDARRLALKYGANPNRWDDVALFLQRKAYPQYSSDAVVKSGRFGGSRQTLAFVNGVMGQYDSYCEMVQR